MFENFKNRIITIEGADGTGKDTIANLLHEKIPDSEVIRFPNYKIPSGERIKAILKKEVPFPGAYEFQSLQLANKIMTLHENHHAKVFIFSRYFESALVYGLSDGLPLDFLLQIHLVLPESRWVFILSGKNYGKNSEYYETDDRQKIISNIYLNLAIRMNWIVIDNNRPPDNITNEILSEISTPPICPKCDTPFIEGVKIRNIRIFVCPHCGYHTTAEE